MRNAGSGKVTAEGRLAWGVLAAAIPIGVAGLAFHGDIARHMRSQQMIAVTTLFFAILLGLADRRRHGDRDEYSLTWREIMAIGLAQTLALIPGTSRSGVTMTVGLFLGQSRSGAARFSFLLSIPTIFMAGSYETINMIRSDAPVDWSGMILGIVVSAASAYLCIRTFLRFLERVGLAPFVIYRLVLGGALLFYSFFHGGN